LSISDRFSVIEREVNGVKIRSLAFNEHASVGDVVADVAVDALTLYAELFGDYERDVLSIVEFNSDIGMEFDGLIFLSPYFYNLYPGTPKSNIHVYTAHEVAHQWFFSLVGNDQALEPWLDEALATYSERLFYERYYPEHLDWWWENYVIGHNPYGKIDISIYFGGDLLEYRDIVYRNGAVFLQELRDTIGDEAFFGFLKDYVQKYRYEIVTADDFWSTLLNHTDADLTNLHNQYFSSPAE
jgi:aminopeptidase N